MARKKFPQTNGPVVTAIDNIINDPSIETHDKLIDAYLQKEIGKKDLDDVEVDRMIKNIKEACFQRGHKKEDVDSLPLEESFFEAFDVWTEGNFE